MAISNKIYDTTPSTPGLDHMIQGPCPSKKGPVHILACEIFCIQIIAGDSRSWFYHPSHAIYFILRLLLLFFYIYLFGVAHYHFMLLFIYQLASCIFFLLQIGIYIMYYYHGGDGVYIFRIGSWPKYVFMWFSAFLFGMFFLFYLLCD